MQPAMRLLLLAALCHTIQGAAVSAPEDSEATVLPPSLIYDERPPVESKATESSTITTPGSDVVVETQHSTCHISTEELVASAKATVTRVLKGICNAREMDDRLHNLEVLIGDQMTVVKTILLSMEERVSEINMSLKKIVSKGCVCEGPQAHPPMEEMQPYELLNGIPNRDSEIQIYNSSIHFINTTPDLVNITKQQEQRVFTYYWRVKDMSNKLTLWQARRSIRSPSFYISPSGYKMYMRLYPKQNGKNVYLHVGLTSGEHDGSLDWPFKLKHRITILDQRETNVQDIHSRVWDPTVLCSAYNWRRPTTGDNSECVGLGFPQEILKSRDYIVNNMMVVKLTVYLDL